MAAPQGHANVFPNSQAPMQKPSPSLGPQSQVSSTSTAVPSQRSGQSASSQPPNPHEALSGPAATAPFLKDFSLVAEAAKRAQMAVVMRDLEGVTL